MLVETDLKIGEACVELGNLLLLPFNHGEHGTNELPHGPGGGGPFVSGNTGRW